MFKLELTFFEKVTEELEESASKYFNNNNFSWIKKI